MLRAAERQRRRRRARCRYRTARVTQPLRRGVAATSPKRAPAPSPPREVSDRPGFASRVRSGARARPAPLLTMNDTHHLLVRAAWPLPRRRHRPRTLRPWYLSETTHRSLTSRQAPPHDPPAAMLTRTTPRPLQQKIGAIKKARATMLGYPAKVEIYASAPGTRLRRRTRPSTRCV
jgi:hypothetical protein